MGDWTEDMMEIAESLFPLISFVLSFWMLQFHDLLISLFASILVCFNPS